MTDQNDRPQEQDAFEVHCGARTPAREPMQNEWVRLTPLQAERDVEGLYRASHGLADQDSVWRFQAVGPFAGKDAMHVWLESCEGSADPLFFAVHPRTGPAAGMVSFLNIAADMRRIEVGHIWYAPSLQRTKLNTAAMRLMLGRAFDDWGYRRVEWKCDDRNEASRQAAVRLGFRFEGVFRQHMIVKRHNRDTAWYAMLDGEWPSIRRNMDDWLSAPDGSWSLTERHRTATGEPPEAGL